MQLRHLLLFTLKSALAGLLVAAIILLLRNGLTGDSSKNHRQSVELGGENLQLSSLKRDTSSSYHLAVQAAAPAVVNVYATKIYEQQPHPLFQDPIFKRFFGEPPAVPNKRRDSNLGSGVIINSHGYVLTNAHVVKDADEVRITLQDGRQGKARIVGSDPDTDLAVLQIEMENLPVISLGDSRQLVVGDVVLAIGNPYDFGQTVTQGIVSATGRKRLGITTFEDFIQTDADINPGNSGGALITANGLLVGINTAIISSTGGSQGIGLATPVHIALDVMQQIISNGQVIRGWLGIEAQVLSPDMLREIGTEHGGVLIAGVLQNGPADMAGLVPGDIILTIQDKPVSDPQQAIQMISHLKPGTAVDLMILRGWQQIPVTAVVAQRPLFKRN